MESLMWSPLNIHSLPISVTRIRTFQEAIQRWKTAHLSNLPGLKSESSLISSENVS